MQVQYSFTHLYSLILQTSALLDSFTTIGSTLVVFILISYRIYFPSELYESNDSFQVIIFIKISKR